MSRTRVYLPSSVATMERFFQAFEQLLTFKKLTISGYCNDFGIDYRNFEKQRRDHARGYFQVGWLVPLVERYKVSADWLLTGRGNAFLP